MAPRTYWQQPALVAVCAAVLLLSAQLSAGARAPPPAAGKDKSSATGEYDPEVFEVPVGAELSVLGDSAISDDDNAGSGTSDVEARNWNFYPSVSPRQSGTRSITFNNYCTQDLYVAYGYETAPVTSGATDWYGTGWFKVEKGKGRTFKNPTNTMYHASIYMNTASRYFVLNSASSSARNLCAEQSAFTITQRVQYSQWYYWCKVVASAGDRMMYGGGLSRTYSQCTYKPTNSQYLARTVPFYMPGAGTSVYNLRNC